MFALELKAPSSHKDEVLTEQEILSELERRKVRNRDLAGLLGISEDKVSKARNGKRRFQADEILTLNRFLSEGSSAPAAQLRDNLNSPRNQFLTASTAHPAPMPYIPPGQWQRDVPVVGGGLAAPLHIVQAGAALDIEQTSLDFGADPDYAPRPPAFASNRQLYCVYVWGDSMVPRFEAGDRLYVDPRRPPSVGDDVVVQLLGEPESDDGQVVVALIKRLARRNGSTIELQQYNPATSIVVETARVAAIHRIVPWRELL